MEPTIEQAQDFYRLFYRLTNEIYPGWPYKSIELVRMDERSGILFVLAGEDLEFLIKPSGGYAP